MCTTPTMSVGVTGSLLFQKSLPILVILTVVIYIFICPVMAPSSFHLESVLMKSQRELSKTVAKCICEMYTLAAENR